MQANNYNIIPIKDLIFFFKNNQVCWAHAFWCAGATHFGECVSHFNDHFSSLHSPPLHPKKQTQIRFVAGDEVWLSPQYNRSETCAISLAVLATRDNEDKYYGTVHALGQGFNGRVHWGKYLYWGPENVRQAYGKYDSFAELRKKMDPKNIFMNTFLEKLFGFV